MGRLDAERIEIAMTKNMKPINYGNSDCITEICTPTVQLPMIRYEAIFDFYSEEPPVISVEKELIHDEIILEQILRIRKWGFNTQSCSWSIYSADREQFSDIVLRKVIWDMKADMKYAKKRIQVNREEILTRWPTITIQNLYLKLSELKEFIVLMNSLDSMIQNGIILREQKNRDCNWRDFELKRLYDWGQIHFTWTINKKNKEVEHKINQLVHVLDSFINKTTHNVKAIHLNYSISPELYKNIIVDKV